MTQRQGSEAARDDPSERPSNFSELPLPLREIVDLRKSLSERKNAKFRTYFEGTAYQRDKRLLEEKLRKLRDELKVLGVNDENY